MPPAAELGNYEKNKVHAPSLITMTASQLSSAYLRGFTVQQNCQNCKNQMADNIVLQTASDNIRIPRVLPHDKIYTIQVGDERFSLSGASLSYDSPSYFTDYFLENKAETLLNIDRSPKVFQKICTHLQGYSIKIDDDYEFVYLLSDASYYRLKKLKERILFEPFHITVGGKKFRIPKEILTQKGNYPNFFSIIYHNILIDPFISNDLFIRPPPLHPYELHRSSVLFEELLNGLYGNEIEIKNEEHRENLLKECRYYQFFALEQRLIKCQLIKNPFTRREEIVLDYKNVKVSGLLNVTNDSIIGPDSGFSTVKYSRPFVDENVYRDLVIQIDSSNVELRVNVSLNFSSLLIKGKTATTLKTLLAKVSEDYIFENEEGESKLTVLIQMTNSVGMLNGLIMEKGWLETLMKMNEGSRKGGEEPCNDNKVVIVKFLKSQWTINVQGRKKVWMNCLKFEGYLDEAHFNEHRQLF